MNDQPVSIFTAACGVMRTFKIAVTQDDNTDKVRLPQPFAIIGRSPQADVQLADECVSWRHAYLQFIEGFLFCVDLQSRTGTHWQSSAGTFGWVLPNDIIRIGPFSITASGRRPGISHDGITNVNPMASDADDRHDSVIPSLEFIDSVITGSGGRRWELNRRLTLVGKSSACKLRLPDSSVSHFHCSLLRTTQGVWVIDLIGNGGIFINDEPASCALLEDGDILRIGKFKIRIHYDHNPNAQPSFFVSLQAKPSTNGGLISHNNTLPKHNGTGHAHMSRPVESGQDLYVSSQSKMLLPALTEVSSTLRSAAGPVSAEHSLAAREMLDAQFGPMLDQYTTMQQQMFDQFRQMVMIFAQTFSTLHKDQVGLVREELDRLHDVNKELHTLHAELAKNSNCKNDPALTSPKSNANGKASKPAALLESRVAEPAAKPADSKPPSQKPAIDATKKGKTVSANEQVRPTTANDHAHVARENKKHAQQSKKNAGRRWKVAETQSSDAPDNEVHGWLVNRLESLQKEQQSRWQSLLGYLFQK